jgi:hypothetical protein
MSKKISLTLYNILMSEIIFNDSIEFLDIKDINDFNFTELVE